MDIFRRILQFFFYPLRLMWSRFFYPPQSVRSKTKPNYLGQYIIQDESFANNYLIFVPGNGARYFDSEYIHKNNVFNIQEFEKTFNKEDWNLEVIPAPCYQHIFSCFSLKNWAKAIEHRVNVIRRIDPNANINIVGISMGGAAVALAAKEVENPEKEAYIIINTFSSLSKLIWNESWISLLSFFIHIVPITLLILTIGLEVCSLTYLIGLSALITSLSILMISSIYIKVENFFSKLYDQYSADYEPGFIRRRNVVIRYLFLYICRLAHLFLLLIYVPTHYIAHAFTYFQIWLLDADALIYKQPLGKNCVVVQDHNDPIIPEEARLADKLTQSPYVIKLNMYKGEHNTIPYEELANRTSTV